ncbi:MAG: RrF2 family transcriptional regulator [Cognatishimia sp.]
MSRILHVLLHLQDIEEPITSELIGQMLGMNASLVRRTMGGLRKAGFVGSSKGHGGGWYLEKNLSEISLADVYEALGAPKLFAIGTSTDTPNCLLEKAANAATTQALDAARDQFFLSLQSVSVSDLTNGSREKFLDFRAQNPA